MDYKITKAVILAAGRGKRLKPFTNVLPKPLLKLRGKTTLDHTLNSLANTNIEKVYLVTNYLEDKIKQHVQNGSNWNLEVVYVHQSAILGTAHALKEVFELSGLEATRFFLLLAADYALTLNHITLLVAAHQKYAVDITVSLKWISPNEITKRSPVLCDEDFYIQKIIEKPQTRGKHQQIGASLIYILPTDIKGYLSSVNKSIRGEYEIPSVINTMIQDGYVARGVLQPAPKEWSPVSDNSL